MLAKTKRAARSAAVTVAAAAAVMVGMPTGNAYAIDHVECIGGVGFLKIYSTSGDVDCFANKGRTGYHGWVSRIYTGDNVLIYYDRNGDSVRIERWTDISFPNRPPAVKDIEIL